jgi:hypothetical protein
MSKKIFLPLWILASFLLFLYSYTQVDLSLTLSRISIYQTVEKGFQYVGWFDRPLSTYLYIGVFTFLFILYFWTIKLVSKKEVSRKIVWTVIFFVTGILFVSYNAFSYDLFNYIFDAKIVTFYHQNPYLHKALDYPTDPMLSFMRWTHRLYPYGPGWLLLTVPLSFIGSNIFIVTFYLFKLLMAGFFLLTVYSIEKIGKILKLSNVLLPVVAFALNPFVLSESLVSAHNDIVMMGLAMFGAYQLLDAKFFKGTILYIFSIGIKFATALILLVFFVLVGIKKKNYFIAASVLVMIIAVLLATIRTNFQPWYLLYIAPFAALLFDKAYVKIPFIIISIAAVIYYVPFLFTGNWNVPIPSILNYIMIISIVLSALTVAIATSFTKRKQ